MQICVTATQAWFDVDVTAHTLELKPCLVEGSTLRAREVRSFVATSGECERSWFRCASSWPAHHL